MSSSKCCTYSCNLSSIKTEIDDIAETSLQNIPAALKGENEGEYNIRFSESHEGYYLLDKKLYRPDGYGRSSVEVADIVTEDKQLVHVKKGGSSSKLSHLFAQGAVSATILAQDEEMKNFINDECKKDIIDLSAPNNEFEIIFAVIDERVGESTSNSDILPFFSMVNLSNTIHQLKSMGFKYSFLKIPVIDEEIKN